MVGKTETIDIEYIDLDNSTYRISSHDKSERLEQSILQYGLLTPCIVRKVPGNFIIISGHKRARAVKALGLQNITAFIIREQEDKFKTDLFCSRLSIMENAFQRELDIIEKARGVHLLSRLISEEIIALESSYVFNAEFNVNTIKRFLKISAMPEQVHDMIQKKQISVNTAIKISEYDKIVFNLFLNIFKNIKMGQNKQLEIVTNSIEIAKRDNLPLSRLLGSEEIQQLVMHEHPDENYKADCLRSYLKKLRFPELSKALENLQHTIRELKLNHGLKLYCPENFEGDDFSIFFEFKNIEGFKHHLNKLSSMHKSKAFEDLFK